MVPNGWSLVKLGDILTLGSGDTKPDDLQKEYSDDSPYPVYGGNNIMGYSSQKNSSDSVILIGRVGEYCGVTRYIDKACWITDNALYTKKVSSEIDKEYLVSKLKKFDLSRLRNKGGQPLVSQKPIYAVKLPMPPLPEQRKIAKILSTWDKAIATTEKLIATSQQQKKALMQQLLTGKKRLVGKDSSRSIRKGFAVNKLGEIPDDWDVELISKHYWYQEGPGVRNHQFTDNGVKLFNGTNIQKSRINLSNTTTYISNEEAYGAYSHFLADSGDLVIACSGISVERFDEKIAFITEKHLPLCMNTSTMRFKVKSEATACLTFMRYFMMSDLFKNQIRRQITGSAQLNFGPSHMAKCFIPLPSLEEQQKIASVLTSADREIELLEAKLAHLKDEKKALMQQLLTGKRRVKVDENVAA
ncbi:restriction endonuclease subunit S [Providencia stuartii]|uniref:restriction endonuclease subunit S n=1 Tax=Providencia stuartii TaxID=588 RepID=UPI0034E47FDE